MSEYKFDLQALKHSIDQVIEKRTVPPELAPILSETHEMLSSLELELTDGRIIDAEKLIQLLYLPEDRLSLLRNALAAGMQWVILCIDAGPQEGAAYAYTALEIPAGLISSAPAAFIPDFGPSSCNLQVGHALSSFRRNALTNGRFDTVYVAFNIAGLLAIRDDDPNKALREELLSQTD